MALPEPPDSVRELKARYRSGEDNLGKDFFAALLDHAIAYDRAAGYFSGGALNAWTGAIPGLAQRRAKIRLLIAAELSPDDRANLQTALKTSEDMREEAEDQIIHALIDAATNIEARTPTEAERAQLLAWLIASGILEIRFAWFQGPSGLELYHEKFGIVTLQGGAQVSFGGSANETYSGHSRNGERIDVFCSWRAGEEQRISSHAEDFAESWHGSAYIRVRKLSEQTLSLVRERAPRDYPKTTENRIPTACAKTPKHNKWRHQEEAAEAFLKVKRGILEMATGTGKTRTAIRILSALRDTGQIDSAIICTNGNDLLDQWYEEMLPWSADGSWRCEQLYGPHSGDSMWAIMPEQAALITNRRKLPDIVKRMSAGRKQRTIIVHDEVHGLGEPSSQASLSGQHADFGFTLGLSATPEREYDDAATAFIHDEVGSVIYRFSLREAIERGILVEFDYEVLEYNLTPSDKERIQAVYARKAARAREGRPMSKEEVWIEVSKVYKTAEEKMPILSSYLQANPSTLDRCIIFADTRDHAEPLYEVIHGLGRDFSQYFADDTPAVLDRFARGELDCLVTCHKLSQGIDIPDLRTVILVSSSRSMLETIQRLGRCLRSNPNQPHKRALVIDFCRSDAGSVDAQNPTADALRVAWLTELAKTRTST